MKLFRYVGRDPLDQTRHVYREATVGEIEAAWRPIQIERHQSGNAPTLNSTTP